MGQAVCAAVEAADGLELAGRADPALGTPLPDVLGAERATFAGRHTTVVGAGHSAANTLIGLAELARTAPGTRVTWLIRSASAVRVSSSPDDDLADRARLGSRVDQLVLSGAVEMIDSFQITRVGAHEGGIRVLPVTCGISIPTSSRKQ